MAPLPRGGALVVVCYSAACCGRKALSPFSQIDTQKRAWWPARSNDWFAMGNAVDVDSLVEAAAARLPWCAAFSLSPAVKQSDNEAGRLCSCWALAMPCATSGSEHTNTRHRG